MNYSDIIKHISVLNAFRDLATKSIFEKSGWLDLNERTTARDVSADFFCSNCKKEKTFLGKAYSKNDLQMQYYQNEAQQDRMNIPYASNYDEDENDTDEMIPEIAFPIADTVTVLLKCPTCKSEVYICYHIEVKYSEIPDLGKHMADNAAGYRHIESICVTKIGEYPNQEISRLQSIQKYLNDFPIEHKYLVKAEKAFATRLGAGAVIYLRKAYEILLSGVLRERNIEIPKKFWETLKKADEVANIIPDELKERDYGLFRDMSNVIHGETDDSIGIDQYETLRDVFKMILDNILQKRKNDELIGVISNNSQQKRKSSNL